jgi:caffeoyl-CoA O-methyltransferase
MAQMLGEDHFRALETRRPDLLRRLEAEAAREDIPIVGPVVGALLELLVRAGGARRVLELGTATGYSALWMAAGMPAGGELVTLETDPRLAARARHALAAVPAGLTVTVLEAAAPAALAGLPGLFDLIFMDIEKADYLACLDPCAALLRPGGVLVADNVAFADAQDFSRALAAEARFRAVQLHGLLPGHSPERDALGLAVRL